MAFTKTVNYVQNVPVALGYLDEVSGTTGDVTVTIKFNSKAGRLSTEDIGGVSSKIGGTGCALGGGNEWSVLGDIAEVNSLLNNLSWLPAAYDDANIQQNFLSEDREVATYRGEVVVETRNRNANAAFALQDKFKLNNSGVITTYTVSAIETSNSNYRLYGTLDNGYGTADNYGPDYKDIEIYTTTLTDESDTLIDNITDYAIINPHGQYFLEIEVTDDNGVFSNDITTLNGSFFVKEPYFDVYPPLEVYSNGPDTWTPVNLGRVDQLDNERISIQVLFKRFDNDPSFDGDIATNTPSYVKDGSYGCVNNIRIDDRISESYEDGVVRWSFYGTPIQCTQALEQLQIYSPPVAYEFLIETRIVNGRARIYNDRGYD